VTINVLCCPIQCPVCVCDFVCYVWHLRTPRPGLLLQLRSRVPAMVSDSGGSRANACAAGYREVLQNVLTKTAVLWGSRVHGRARIISRGAIIQHPIFSHVRTLQHCRPIRIIYPSVQALLRAASNNLWRSTWQMLVLLMG
jgi:hypothetical protein